MQKLLLTFLMVLTLGATAQQTHPTNTPVKKQAARQITERFGADNPEISAQSNSGLHNEAPVGHTQRNMVGIQIGTTIYDLQTNSGMCRRVSLDDNGGVHAMWTMGESVAAANRGTGYNYSTDGGTTWGAIPTPGVGRLESVRTGWPNIGVTQNGRIFSITHTGAAGMNFCYKDAGGDWTDFGVGAEYGDLAGVWARAAVSGNTIHAVIGRQYNPTASPAALNTFPPDEGVYGGLAYFKSTDGGDTWSEPVAIPMLGDYFYQVFADDYSIDAAGDVVAVVVNTTFGNTVLFKSTDAGATWTPTVIMKAQSCNLIDVFNEAGEVSAFYGGGGSASVVIDSNGKVHVVTDRQIHGRSADFEAGSSYATAYGAALVYWNEDFGADPSGEMDDDVVRLIPKTLLMDMNSDCKADMVHYGVLDANGNPSSIETRSYGTTIGQVSLGIDDQNNLYVAYSAVVDADYELASNEVDTLRYFRDVFLLKGINGNQSWEGPYNVTAANGKSEDVFPSIARRVDGFVHLVYQSDPITGTALQNTNGQGHPAGTDNQILYVKVPVGDIVTPTLNNTCPDMAIFKSSFSVQVPPGCTPDAEVHFNSFAVDFPDGDSTPTIGATFDVNTIDEAGNWILSISDSDGNEDSDTLFLADSGVVTVTADANEPLIVVAPYEICEPYCSLNAWAADGGIADCVFSTTSVELEIGSSFTPEAGVVDDYTLFGCDVPVTWESEPVLDLNSNGTYTITFTATDPSGNTATETLEVVVGNGVGIQTPANEPFAVKVFPNPSNGMLNISLGETQGAANVQVFNAAGELVKNTQTSGSNATILDLTRVPGGIYMVKVTTDTGTVVRKVTIE